jgi:hypothetical protein
MKGKKGGEKLISIWWFMVLIIVATGIVIGVSAYYTAEVDVKAVEADILSEKVLDCMSQNGFVPEGFFKDNFDILHTCKLSQKVFEAGSNFFFRVSLYDSNGKLIKSSQAGDASFEKSCAIQKEVTAVNFPICVNKKESVIYLDRGDIRRGELQIIAGSNQYGRRLIASV